MEVKPWKDALTRFHANEADEAAQRRKFYKSPQKVNKECFGEDAIDEQKGAIDNGLLTYEGHGHEKAAIRIYKLNALLPLFGQDAESFSDKKRPADSFPNYSKEEQE